ncbi:hypothetical protein [Candidatus Villigracilis affinis]|uniref:hypothetical protein n=1 Tax=Candidatus Villigracilis affinis TaxID=3140682 RepID=UPI002A211663|nr:hypothetical protein [Anaerolineales bacterium]
MKKSGRKRFFSAFTPDRYEKTCSRLRYRRISITDMEYGFTAQRCELRQEQYFFVIDEENQPWLPKFMEGEPGASKLKDFKRRIQTASCAFHQHTQIWA